RIGHAVVLAAMASLIFATPVFADELQPSPTAVGNKAIAINGGSQTGIGLLAAATFFFAHCWNECRENALASGGHSVASGANAAATGLNSIAQGSDAKAMGANTVVIGPSASAATSAVNAVAIGSGAQVGVEGSPAQNAQSMAIGPSALAIGQNSIAFG